jgi:hypothetical protein
MSTAASWPGVRELTPEEVVELENNAHLQIVLHFEIESFFLFAKILLDKIAQCIEDFFGPARGASLRSHDKWCKAIDTYVQAKQLVVPPGIHKTIYRLRFLVADYRDKQITHFQNPRAFFATFITADDTTQIGIDALYPKEDERVITSPPVNEVYGLIEDYVGQMMRLIDSNRSRARYTLRNR